MLVQGGCGSLVVLPCCAWGWCLPAFQALGFLCALFSAARYIVMLCLGGQNQGGTARFDKKQMAEIPPL